MLDETTTFELALEEQAAYELPSGEETEPSRPSAIPRESQTARTDASKYQPILYINQPSHVATGDYESEAGEDLYNIKSRARQRSVGIRRGEGEGKEKDISMMTKRSPKFASKPACPFAAIANEEEQSFVQLKGQEVRCRFWSIIFSHGRDDGVTETIPALEDVAWRIHICSQLKNMQLKCRPE